jgi:hypothetical protein
VTLLSEQTKPNTNCLAAPRFTSSITEHVQLYSLYSLSLFGYTCRTSCQSFINLNGICKLNLAQMIFLVVQLNHPVLNPRFDVDVTYLRLIILSMIDDVPVDSETLFDRLRESLRSNRFGLPKVFIWVEYACVYL